MDEEPDPIVIVCQGPPVCLLMGDEAEKAAKDGCPWCTRITIHEDGSQTVHEPTRQ